MGRENFDMLNHLEGLKMGNRKRERSEKKTKKETAGETHLRNIIAVLLKKQKIHFHWILLPLLHSTTWDNRWGLMGMLSLKVLMQHDLHNAFGCPPL